MRFAMSCEEGLAVGSEESTELLVAVVGMIEVEGFFVAVTSRDEDEAEVESMLWFFSAFPESPDLRSFRWIALDKRSLKGMISVSAIKCCTVSNDNDKCNN